MGTVFCSLPLPLYFIVLEAGSFSASLFTLASFKLTTLKGVFRFYFLLPLYVAAPHYYHEDAPSFTLIYYFFIARHPFMPMPAKSLQSCPTLWDPMDCSPPDSSVHGILQARILEWVAIPFSRGSSWPRDQTQVSCIASRFFTIWATREAPHALTSLLPDLVCPSQ